MNNVARFLISASFVVLSTNAASGAAARTLYSQNSNYAGAGINSENYTSSFDLYTDQAADDFVVPAGSVWHITEVDVSGAYQGGGTDKAQSENVVFYHSDNAVPGKAVRKGMFTNVKGTHSAGDFAIKLSGAGLALKRGHYWVSVVINTGFNGAYWYWDESSLQHNKEAAWQNPEEGWGYSCESWCAIDDAGASGPDLMFDLKGTSNRRSAQ